MRAELKRLKRDTDSGRSAVLPAADPPPTHAPPVSSTASQRDAGSATPRSGSPIPPDPPSATGQAFASAAAIAPSAAGRTRWRGALAALIAIAILVVAAVYWRSHVSAKLSERDTIVLTDFVNTTGDSVFDGALCQGLASQLEQSPFLNLLSDEKIAQTLALMAQSRDTRLTTDLARQVCQRTASAATIEGSVSSLGAQYVLGLKAINCHNGDQLAAEQVTAAGKEQILKALGDASTKIREKLGESLATLQKFDAPPESVTTASLEALQAYSIGLQDMIVKGDYIAAIPFFQRAAQLDPNFGMAYARIGTCYFQRRRPNPRLRKYS
jgi:hypothetical protein